MSSVISDASFITWKESLPSSRIVRPESGMDLFKYIIWRCYTPFHPFVRDLLLAVGVLSHSGRQPFLIGKIAQGVSIQDFVAFLIERGYGNHFIAWRDDGEILGLRFVESFKHQYHIRIFNDGEVRGHYEYTPEYRPILHFKAVGREDCRESFLAMLGDKVIPAK